MSFVDTQTHTHTMHLLSSTSVIKYFPSRAKFNLLGMDINFEKNVLASMGVLASCLRMFSNLVTQPPINQSEDFRHLCLQRYPKTSRQTPDQQKFGPNYNPAISGPRDCTILEISRTMNHISFWKQKSSKQCSIWGHELPGNVYCWSQKSPKWCSIWARNCQEMSIAGARNQQNGAVSGQKMARKYLLLEPEIANMVDRFLMACSYK